MYLPCMSIYRQPMDGQYPLSILQSNSDIALWYIEHKYIV